MISLLIQPEVTYFNALIREEKWSFIRLEKNSPSFEFVKEIFARMIKPVYGDISLTLEKIKKGEDRRCEFMVSEESGECLGLIIYKTALVNEFAKLGIRNSLEVKTLLVIDPEKNSGRGIGTALLKRVESVASQLNASSMHLTVSEMRPQALKFFEKRNFKVHATWQDKYKKGVKEYLLAKPLPQKAPPNASFQLVLLIVMIALSSIMQGQFALAGQIRKFPL
jgi:ribosomal protein S18 acetylase RimI-like enzyme